MRKLLKHNHADINMVLTAVVMAIVFAISIVIVYSIFGGLDLSSVDADIDTRGDWGSGLNQTPAANATENVLSNLAVFYTIGPIAIIVVAAVGIIGYILLIRGRR